MLQGAPKDFFDNPEKKNELIGKIDRLIGFNDEMHRYFINSLKHSRNPISFFDCLNDSVQTWNDLDLADDIYNALKESFSLSFLDIYFNHPINDSLDDLISDEFLNETVIGKSGLHGIDSSEPLVESRISNRASRPVQLENQLDLFADTEAANQYPNNQIDDNDESVLKIEACPVEDELDGNVDTEVSFDNSEIDSDFQAILDNLGTPVTTKKIDGVNVAYKQSTVKKDDGSNDNQASLSDSPDTEPTKAETVETECEIDELHLEVNDDVKPNIFDFDSDEEADSELLDFISKDTDDDDDAFVEVDYLDDSNIENEYEFLGSVDNDEADSFVDAEELGYLFEDDSDYDISVESEYFKDVVTLEERARQKAIEFVQQVDWCPKQDLEMVTNVFIDYGWGPTRLALKRLISYGLEPEELRVVYEIKKVWQRNDYFWVSFNKNCEDFALSHHVMSWNVAFRISRAFKSYPDAEEVEGVLERLYEFWMSKFHLKLSYRTFLKFIWTWAFEPKRVLSSEYTYVFELNEMTPDEWHDSTDVLDISLQQDVVHYGLYEAEAGSPYEYWTEERAWERFQELNGD